jgi:hypothetical protein
MKVEMAPEAIEYFNELSAILYERDYFGFEENAVKYVNELLDDIIETLPYRVKKIAPAYFDKYGKKMLYSLFQKNKNTQWYVFFNIYKKNGELIYLVRYVNNNHIIAQYL